MAFEETPEGQYIMYDEFDVLRAYEFLRWIVSLDDDDPESPGRKDRQTVTLTKIINRAKEALNG